MFTAIERIAFGLVVASVFALIGVGIYAGVQESRVSRECLALGYWTGSWGPVKGSWCGRMENQTQVVFTLQDARNRSVR